MVISEPHLEWGMGQSVVKRFRLSVARAKKLERIARERKTTESEILREGLEMVEEREARLATRREGIEGLISMIEGPEPKKVRWRGKY